jgi:hypothetical protein
MAPLLPRFGVAVVLALLAGTVRAQQGTKSMPEEDAAPRVIVRSTPKPEPAAAPRPAEPVAPAPDRGRMPDLNGLITDLIREMPSGGGYATNAGSFAALRQGIRTDPQGRINIDPSVVHPSFCSGATYLVLMGVVHELQSNGVMQLPADVMAALEVRSQPDGVGVWGRWNANGPGTARLFHELGLGRNFTDFAEARPGDFIKMFWNEHIGSLERGHSAVFIGTGKDERGQDTVTFWSSNIPGGFGMKTIPKTNIKRALFSRLENPRGLVNAARLPTKDDYLAAMLKRTSPPDEMLRMVGVENREGAGRLPPPRQEVARTPAPATPAGAATPAASAKNRTATPTQTPAATPKKSLLQKLIGK